MEETRQLQSYELVDTHDLVISQLPEKIRNKFEALDEVLDNYENAETDKEMKDIMAQIEAYDTGLSSDIRSYLAEKQDSENDEEDSDSEGKMAQGGQTDTQPNHDNPSWRFWM